MPVVEGAEKWDIRPSITGKCDDGREHNVARNAAGMSGLASLLRWTAALVALCYVIGLGLWAIGANGLFGMEQDSLSAIVLDPLGWPWTKWSGDDQLYMVAPALNVIVLWLLSKIVGARA